MDSEIIQTARNLFAEGKTREEVKATLIERGLTEANVDKLIGDLSLPAQNIPSPSPSKGNAPPSTIKFVASVIGFFAISYLGISATGLTMILYKSNQALYEANRHGLAETGVGVFMFICGLIALGSTAIALMLALYAIKRAKLRNMRIMLLLFLILPVAVLSSIEFTDTKKYLEKATEKQNAVKSVGMPKDSIFVVCFKTAEPPVASLIKYELNQTEKDVYREIFDLTVSESNNGRIGFRVDTTSSVNAAKDIKLVSEKTAGNSEVASIMTYEKATLPAKLCGTDSNT